MIQNQLQMSKEMTRVYHKWNDWECYPAGMHDEKAPRGLTKDQAEEEYRAFLANEKMFEWASVKMVESWEKSCEHNLTNESMNRVAWIGQASACYHLGLPSRYRNGYNLLSDDQKEKANAIAERTINYWLLISGYEKKESDELKSKSIANRY